jgi:uncharacterized protein (TIGR03382 family)
MGLDPQALSFTMTEGDPLPAGQELGIENLGGGELRFTASPTGTWFELSSLSGTAPHTLTVTPVDDGLTPGRYEAAIMLTAPGAEPAMVPVSMAVEAKPAPDGGPDPDTGDGDGGCNTAGSPLDAWPLLLLSVWLMWMARRRPRRS